jgi:hypothetical protein
MVREDEPQIDTNRPNAARVYDAFLGGRDNYEVDREFCREMLRIDPETATVIQQGRAWLIRVVRFLADSAGIDQFLDCGSGLPTAENTHQVAQRANPEATVVYVDNDPMVAAYSRALLEENERTHFVGGDLRRPEELLAHPTIRDNLDFDRPVALIQSMTFHQVSDENRPHEIMKSYVDALSSGSFVAISDLYDPVDDGHHGELLREARVKVVEMLGAFAFRPRSEIIALFDGVELLEPGVVPLFQWWPDGPYGQVSAGHHLLLGGVGRKP